MAIAAIIPVVIVALVTSLPLVVIVALVTSLPLHRSESQAVVVVVALVAVVVALVKSLPFATVVIVTLVKSLPLHRSESHQQTSPLMPYFSASSHLGLTFKCWHPLFTS